MRFCTIHLNLKEKTIIKSLKKYGVSNVVNGTENDAIFERSDNNSLDESNTNGDINETSASGSYVNNN